MLEQSRDPSKKILKKVRQCFIYEKQYFYVETFLNVDEQPSFLRIETSTKDGEIIIPSFVKVVREVTHDKHYTSSEMSSKEHKMLDSDKKKIKELLSQGKK